MDDLRTRIRTSIRDGCLPGVDCLVTWYGPGRGQLCEACGHRMLGSDLAVECDLPDGGTIRFHAPCYEIWRSELTR